MATSPNAILITLTIILDLQAPIGLSYVETSTDCYVDFLAQMFFRQCKAYYYLAASENFIIEADSYDYPGLNTWKIGISRYIENITVNGAKTKDRKYYNTYQESVLDRRRKNNTDKPFNLVMKAYGHGLGNKMFMYASSLAVAKWNNMQFTYDNPRREIETIFHPTAKIVHYEPNLTDSYLQIKTYTCCEFYPELKNLPREDIHLTGYLQSWWYLEAWEEEIRREFTFQDNILESAREKFSKMISKLENVPKSNSATFIGLHVRRGDFTYDQNLIKHGHKVADVEYIKKAKQYFKERYPASVFIVCSDEILWCKDNIPDEGDVVFAEEDNPAHLDLAILSLCHHTIMTVGTFSWWAAWLTGGEATYYADWPRTGSGFEGSMNKSDYFLPHWIGL